MSSPCHHIVRSGIKGVRMEGRRAQGDRETKVNVRSHRGIDHLGYCLVVRLSPINYPLTLCDKN